MASINHLEMAEAFKALPQVEFKKSFFGLSTTILYKKTNSKIHIIQNEYDAYNGKLLEDLLLSPEKQHDTDIKKSSIGNIRLDVCISEDKQFVAAQLLHYVDFNYLQMTDMKVFEGDAAKQLAKVIL